MALASALIGDRWTLLILREAFYGVVRYDDMLADLEAPRSTLTDRLRKLLRAGLMRQEPYQEAGARTRQAYVLTESGRSLGTTFIALSEWGEQHVLGRSSPVAFVDSKSNTPVRTKLVGPAGKSVELKDVKVRVKKTRNV